MKFSEVEVESSSISIGVLGPALPLVLALLHRKDLKLVPQVFCFFDSCVMVLFVSKKAVRVRLQAIAIVELSSALCILLRKVRRLRSS